MASGRRKLRKLTATGRQLHPLAPPALTPGNRLGRHHHHHHHLLFSCSRARPYSCTAHLAIGSHEILERARTHSHAWPCRQRGGGINIALAEDACVWFGGRVRHFLITTRGLELKDNILRLTEAKRPCLDRCFDIGVFSSHCHGVFESGTPKTADGRLSNHTCILH